MVQELREWGEEGVEIGGVVLVVGEGDGLMLGWREHGGGVSFEEEAIGGDVLEGFADAGFALVEEVAVEGEVGSEFGEGGEHFGAAGVGVEEKRRELGLLLKEF